MLCVLTPKLWLRGTQCPALYVWAENLHSTLVLAEKAPLPTEPPFQPCCFCFWDKFSLCSPGWPETHYVAQVGFKLTILLPKPPQHWHYSHDPLALTSSDLNFLVQLIDFVHTKDETVGAQLQCQLRWMPHNQTTSRKQPNIISKEISFSWRPMPACLSQDSPRKKGK